MFAIFAALSNIRAFLLFKERKKKEFETARNEFIALTDNKKLVKIEVIAGYKFFILRLK